MSELEPRKLRVGEDRNRSYGGNVADKPFSRALSQIARSRGHETQTSFSRAVGVWQTSIGDWYRGEGIPSPENFDKLLLSLEPNEEERDKLVEAYGQALVQSQAERTGYKKRRNKDLRTPFEEWEDRFCQARNMQQADFFGLLGLKAKNMISHGVVSFGKILEMAPIVHRMTPEEVDSLGQAIAETMEKMAENGHVFKGNISPRPTQERLSCKTYNGSQAAKVLGISRERVRQLREKLGLPLLLTDQDLERLRAARSQNKTE